MPICPLLHMYIWRYIHYSIPTYVVMYITTNAHMYICTYGHYIIPLYVGYSIPLFLPPVLPYPYPPIPPLNRLSEPCKVSVDLQAHMLTSPYPPLYAMDGGLKGNLLYPLPVGFIHSLYASFLAWFLLGFKVISLKLGIFSI